MACKSVLFPRSPEVRRKRPPENAKSTLPPATAVQSATTAKPAKPRDLRHPRRPAERGNSGRYWRREKDSNCRHSAHNRRDRAGPSVPHANNGTVSLAAPGTPLNPGIPWAYGWSLPRSRRRRWHPGRSPRKSLRWGSCRPAATAWCPPCMRCTPRDRAFRQR
jgi:hypothetical protein